MSISIIQDLVITPAPRDVEAPWLSANSTKWELVEDFVVMYFGAEFVVPKGYYTDFSSIPRIIRGIYPNTITGARRASVLHDRIYSHEWYRYSKKFADKQFYNMMKSQGMPYFRAQIFYLAVRANITGGGWA